MVGIYLIENTENHKKYIGQSRDIEKRWRRHSGDLKNGYHDNRYLQRAYNLGQHFEYSVLEECDPEQLDELERKWISFYGTADYRNGYNLDEGGNFGKTLSERNLALRKGQDSPNYGKSLSEETKEKMRKSARGKNNKLSISDVEQIKVDFLGGKTVRELSNEYGVQVSTIGKITTCKNWEWVLPELSDRLCNKVKNDRDALKETVLDAFNSGMTVSQIMDTYGLSYSVVYRILGNTSYHSDEFINSVREDFLSGMSKREILKKYDISSTTYVRYVSDLINKKEVELRIQAKEMRASGMKVCDIAKALGKHRTTITEWTYG